jgi:hypothetical protein
VLPVVNAFRLADPKWGPLDPDSVTIAGEEQVNEIRCIVLDQEADRQGRPDHRRWWVAPSMDYSVLRSERLGADGDALGQTDLRYAQEAGTGWRLSGWSASGGAGRCECSDMRLVTDSELSEQDFAIVFPPGTVVYDDAVDEKYVVGDVQAAEATESDKNGEATMYAEAPPETAAAGTRAPGRAHAPAPSPARAPQPPGAEPAPDAGSWPSWVFVAVVVAAAVAGMGLAIHRRSGGS